MHSQVLAIDVPIPRVARAWLVTWWDEHPGIECVPESLGSMMVLLVLRVAIVIPCDKART